ncbi:hypothetical protein DQ04_08061010 [Trypanosoma grayi]|uniref:hypothetical protein n=1 Tax=Trypanosoma grayi TaxID=71804 RepID=UPI0004F4BA6E|nr:hypothetical protein DQ04_08061010 [Trypanosoma grayi]KEG08077.1 hypothetical protein DQ04_08061010 [Trypanosoma grayi]
MKLSELEATSPLGAALYDTVLQLQMIQARLSAAFISLARKDTFLSEIPDVLRDIVAMGSSAKCHSSSFSLGLFSAAEGLKAAVEVWRCTPCAAPAALGAAQSEAGG